MRNNKKTIILIVIISVIAVSILGIAYALYEHYEETETRKLIAGDIYMTLVDGEEDISLTNATPLTEEEAREEDDNYFTFTVEGSNNGTKDIYYEILLTYGNDVENKVRLNDKDLKFDLVELDQDNEDAEITPYVVSAKSYVSLDNQRIYAFKIDAGDTNYSKKFKLRMWISTDLLISDTDPDRTYCATDGCVEGELAFGKHYASVKVAVKGGHEIVNAPQSLYNTIATLANEENDNHELVNTYIGKYSDIITSNPTFVSQDTVGTNSNKQEIYYYTGADALANGNVLFAGYCWQIVRTTDDGGVKLIYNGPAYEDTCIAGRSPLRQFTGTANQNADANKVFINQEYLYADSFSYNEETRVFVLNNHYTAVWSDSDSDHDGEADYKALIGKYTCMGSYSCSTLYYVGHRQENGEPSYVTYTLSNSSNTALVSQIGTSPFNAYYDSPNLVGYMYNGGVAVKGHTTTPEAMAEITFGNYVEYNNGVYTLKATGTGIANSRHYTCNIADDENATDTTCEVVRYYYRTYNNSGTYTYYFIRLRNGRTIEDEMKEMFNYKEISTESDVNINQYSSAIKGLLDNWYLQNLSPYANYLDNETVYCNNRSTSSYDGWIKDGNLNSYITYGGATSNANLNCSRIVDRFSVNNDVAKLTYPIGLLTEPERYLMGSGYAVTGQYWWLATPDRFDFNYAFERVVTTAGGALNANVSYGYAARPVITIMPGVDIIDGDGGYETPYVISVNQM